MGITTLATVADHIVPHRGDPDLFWNGDLQSLCKDHHDSEARLKDMGKEAKPTLKGCDTDGMPLDPNHPWNLG